MLLLLALGLPLIAGCSSPAALKIGSVPLPHSIGGASFDVVEIDQAGHRAYVADRAGGVDVFDLSQAKAKYASSISMPASANGLALAPALGRLFVGLADGTVAIVDVKPGSPSAGTVIQIAKTGGKEADLLDYAASTNQVYVSNGVGGTITQVDAQSGDVKAHFKVGYALEQPRFNPADGMLYVTSPDADALFRIDPAGGAIKSKMALGGCSPMGMAIDPHTDHALIACRLSVIDWDLRTGNAANFGQVEAGDVVTYDPKVDQFFVASPSKGRGGAVGIFSANPVDYVSTVVTGAGGNSAAYDETHGVVYTPDDRPNRAGLASFQPPSADQALTAALPSLIPIGVLLLAVGLFLVIIARQADPIRRPVTPAAK
ncbi:MAG: YncE family protein [Candidatus Dormibacteraceae bacterium]